MTRHCPTTLHKTAIAVLITVTMALLFWPGEAIAQNFGALILQTMRTGHPSGAPATQAPTATVNHERPQSMAPWRAPNSTRDIVHSVPVLGCADQLLQLTKQTVLPFGLAFGENTRRSHQMRTSAANPRHTAERTVSNARQVHWTAHSCKRTAQAMGRR